MMKPIAFEKEDLVNLETSIRREILGTNRAGSYLNTSLVGCNTRKYHGLLVCPIDKMEGENYVLLNALNETIIQHEQSFNLGTFRYPGVYDPKGYRYLREFRYEPTATFIYRVGGVVLQKEMMMMHNKDQMMIRYTLLEAHSPTRIRIRPFTSFRSRHKLSKANMFVKHNYLGIENGIGTQMYEGFPTLNIQLSRTSNFVHDHNWYYNIEYLEEQARGYDFQEDLFSIGYFELPIKKGESIVFSASLEEEKSRGLSGAFENELKARLPKNTFETCMKHAATQFVVRRGKNTAIVAGYPWFGRWGRDTFIALPGLTLAANNDPKSCKDVLDTLTKEMKNGLFPNIGLQYSSVDAPMWFFWTLQKYAEATKGSTEVWNDYGKKMKAVLTAYRNGVNDYIGMHDNGLIWAKEPGKGLTWMDAIAPEGPVTQRGGYVVEINTLWYNAICYTLELAEANGDKKFVKEWKDMPALVAENFNKLFWNEELGYLADYVDEHGQNMDLRSNQVIATSVAYSPIDDQKKDIVLKIIKKELLTPKGLRTLSPSNPQYKGTYKGDQPTRDRAYHQGTVWVWQLGHYVEGMFKLYGSTYSDTACRIISGFEEGIADYGICGIAEVFDGDPAHRPGGCSSQAWSVSEMLRIMQMIEQYK